MHLIKQKPAHRTHLSLVVLQICSYLIFKVIHRKRMLIDKIYILRITGMLCIMCVCMIMHVRVTWVNVAPTD